MTGNETFINVFQVAEFLKLSVPTIRKWVFTGYIPYKKIGRAVRFSTAEIEDWARSKSVSPVTVTSASDIQEQEYEGGDRYDNSL